MRRSRVSFWDVSFTYSRKFTSEIAGFVSTSSGERNFRWWLARGPLDGARDVSRSIGNARSLTAALLAVEHEAEKHLSTSGVSPAGSAEQPDPRVAMWEVSFTHSRQFTSEITGFVSGYSGERCLRWWLALGPLGRPSDCDRVLGDAHTLPAAFAAVEREAGKLINPSSGSPAAAFVDQPGQPTKELQP